MKQAASKQDTKQSGAKQSGAKQSGAKQDAAKQSAAKQDKQPPTAKQEKQQAAAARQEKKQPTAERAASTGGTAARLKTLYREKVVPDLQKQFSFGTSMRVPRIVKITLNMGVGEAVADKKNIDAAVADLTRIAGQKPVVTRARKAIANFKIRQGLPIGCMVTLRGSRMYEFLDRLITIAFPRMRDFRGVSARAFDGRGNYSIGFKEQIIFPEIEYDKIDKVRGLNVAITTTARSDEEAKALLTAFRFPFRN
jgi:large subunit ribosomal protein L5